MNAGLDNTTWETAWHVRCRTQAFSAGVAGVARVRRTGVPDLLYPRLLTGSARAELAPEERAALEEAERVVSAHLAARRKAFAVVPALGVGCGFPIGEALARFDAALVVQTIILVGAR